MTKDEAQQAYRDAWKAWLIATSAQEKRPLERLMDSLQATIAKGPRDPDWKDFICTLPGFEDFWSNWYCRMEQSVPFNKD